MRASVKVLHLRFSKLEISAPNICLWIWNQELMQNKTSVSLVSFPLVPNPECLRGLQCIHLSGCLTFYFIPLSSFFLPESDQQQFHNLIPSNGNVPRWAGKPGQWIRESSVVQFSFVVIQKAPCFRNNMSSSFTSSSLFSAMYLDKGNFYSLRPR